MRQRRAAMVALAALAGAPGCDPEPMAHASVPAADGVADGGAIHAAAGPGARWSEPDGSAGPRVGDEAGDDPRSRLDEPASPIILRRPPPRPARAPLVPEPSSAGIRTALAWQFDAPIFRRPGLARRPLGLVRRSTRLPVAAKVEGDGCPLGWYALVDGGFVCEGDGFVVAIDPAPLPEPLQVVPPAAAEPLPYRYAKLRTPAPIYWRLPTEDEMATAAPEPVRERATGAWFVATDEHHVVGDEAISRTVRGFYVRDRDLDERPAATMAGALLDGPDALPLAFVREDDAPLVDPRTGAPVGMAERFARFAVASTSAGVPEGSGAWVVARQGFAIDGRHVRLARARPRPPEVAEGERWIHVDLAEQVLVAYEGDRPVLATLVSSGKPGFGPPLGLFRVHKKHATVTMAGPDPDAGTYTVEEVPWTMYYWGSFALHGAYWHDEFGQVRSHGCTNLPPVDAHWLFHWSTPTLVEGWHAAVGIKGPWVLFTRGGEAVPVTPSAGA